jgi:hypothetical protein
LTLEPRLTRTPNGMMAANGKDNVGAFRREGRDAFKKAIRNVLKENKEVAIWWRLGNEKTGKKIAKGVDICIVAGRSRFGW